MFIFWVTDNFLMRHTRKKHNGGSGEQSIIQRVKVKYRSIRKDKENESESEALISGDEELLGSIKSVGVVTKKIQQRISVVQIA